MNGADSNSIKKAAISKAKQVAHAANGNGGKKRRKGQDLKPIITTEKAQNQDGTSSASSDFRYVHMSTVSLQMLAFVLPAIGQAGSWQASAGPSRPPRPRKLALLVVLAGAANSP